MIKIKKSTTKLGEPTTLGNLITSNYSHIRDVWEGLSFFHDRLLKVSEHHDDDKILEAKKMLEAFNKGGEAFQNWFLEHARRSRHHLNIATGVPDDVNLLDVLEYITDCVMAGMARNGEVYDVTIKQDVLMAAFQNTVKMLKDKVEVEEQP